LVPDSDARVVARSQLYYQPDQREMAEIRDHRCHADPSLCDKLVQKIRDRGISEDLLLWFGRLGLCLMKGQEESRSWSSLACMALPLLLFSHARNSNMKTFLQFVDSREVLFHRKDLIFNRISRRFFKRDIAIAWCIGIPPWTCLLKSDHALSCVEHL
jgi:hypothetical protein